MFSFHRFFFFFVVILFFFNCLIIALTFILLLNKHFPDGKYWYLNFVANLKKLKLNLIMKNDVRGLFFLLLR
jgi:hypothetical protein